MIFPKLISWKFFFFLFARLVIGIRSSVHSNFFSQNCETILRNFKKNLYIEKKINNINNKFKNRRKSLSYKLIKTSKFKI